MGHQRGDGSTTYKEVAMPQEFYDEKADAVRQMTHPELLVQFHAGFGNYMMPTALMPDMDCANCQWHAADWRDGGHCYMFREKPDGDKCGQMRRTTTQGKTDEGITDTSGT